MTIAGYRPSVVLFRQAVAASQRARARRQDFETTDDGERRNREIDACIVTIVLTQAAMEAWINEVHMANGVLPLGGWMDRWSGGLPRLAEARHVVREPMPGHLTTRIRTLSAWRNFLVHGDRTSRERFESIVGIDIRRAPEHLDADLAEWCVSLADHAFEFAAGPSGMSMSPSRLLWVAADET